MLHIVPGGKESLFGFLQDENNFTALSRHVEANLQLRKELSTALSELSDEQKANSYIELMAAICDVFHDEENTRLNALKTLERYSFENNNPLHVEANLFLARASLDNIAILLQNNNITSIEEETFYFQRFIESAFKNNENHPEIWNLIAYAVNLQIDILRFSFLKNMNLYDFSIEPSLELWFYLQALKCDKNNPYNYLHIAKFIRRNLDLADTIKENLSNELMLFDAELKSLDIEALIWCLVQALTLNEKLAFAWCFLGHKLFELNNLATLIKNPKIFPYPNDLMKQMLFCCANAIKYDNTNVDAWNLIAVLFKHLPELDDLIIKTFGEELKELNSSERFVWLKIYFIQQHCLDEKTRNEQINELVALRKSETEESVDLEKILLFFPKDFSEKLLSDFIKETTPEPHDEDEKDLFDPIKFLSKLPDLYSNGENESVLPRFLTVVRELKTDPSLRIKIKNLLDNNPSLESFPLIQLVVAIVLTHSEDDNTQSEGKEKLLAYENERYTENPFRGLATIALAEICVKKLSETKGNKSPRVIEELKSIYSRLDISLSDSWILIAKIKRDQLVLNNTTTWLALYERYIAESFGYKNIDDTISLNNAFNSIINALKDDLSNSKLWCILGDLLLNPQIDRAFLSLPIGFPRDQNPQSQAFYAYTKAIALNPKNADALYGSYECLANHDNVNYPNELPADFPRAATQHKQALWFLLHALKYAFEKNYFVKPSRILFEEILHEGNTAALGMLSILDERINQLNDEEKFAWLSLYSLWLPVDIKEIIGAKQFTVDILAKALSLFSQDFLDQIIKTISHIISNNPDKIFEDKINAIKEKTPEYRKSWEQHEALVSDDAKQPSDRNISALIRYGAVANFSGASSSAVGTSSHESDVSYAASVSGINIRYSSK